MYRRISERMALPHKRSKKRANHLCCNLCGKSFHARNAFQRYCLQCKREEELLKFSDWLPELDQTLNTQIPA